MSIARSAPAKINLGLHVLRRRPDGYHDLETVFLRIGWADTVRVEPAPGLAFTCSDPMLPTDDTNLCVRAARALAARAGIEPAARIHLEKRVPYGAGLGGGSSDAAATLRSLDALWRTGFSRIALHDLAAGLGSDVPFFLGEPAAFGSGRGEILQPLTVASGKGYRCPFYLVVVKPDIAVGTADAYRWITPSAEGRPDLRDLVAGNDLARWRLELVNDFEKPVFDRYPLLRTIRDDLLADGAGYAALSGSGSALFGLFVSPESGRMAAMRWENTGLRCWHGLPDAGDLSA